MNAISYAITTKRVSGMRNVHIHQVRLLHDLFPTNRFYPFNLEIFHKTSSLEFNRPVTFFIGENGSGKSTLLKAIARHGNIHIWEEDARSRYHFNAYEDALHQYIDVKWTGQKVPGSYFASEIFRYFAGILDEWAVPDPGSLKYFGNESLIKKSHGQSHMAYFSHRFKRKGLYLLDEPENALSPRMQLALLQLFRSVTASGNAQFIIASHSPILLAYPDAEIYSFNDIPIRKVAYEETDYFRIYRDFLNDRTKYIQEIEKGCEGWDSNP
jgi:predicted ATPase